MPLVVIVFCLGATQSRAQGTLTFTPNYINFGKVAVNATDSVAVTVKNTGKSTVAFSGDTLTAAAQFSMSGFVMPVTLAVGKSLTFTVKFSPTLVGAKSGTLTFLSNATNNRVVMWLNGSGVQASVAATPASASFGNVSVGVTNSQTIQLKNSGTSSLTVSAATATGTGFSVNNIKLPLSLAAGKTATFNIAFSPKAAGSVTGTASIAGNFPTLTVPASGTGVSGTRVLSASATSENFGNVAVGSSASATIALTDTGNSSVTISGVSCSGAGVSGSGAVNVTLNPGQSTPLTVKFAPTKTGSVSGSVAVTSNASDSPFAISVSGSGVSATATHSVNLSWAASASSGVTGYEVYRSTISGGPYTKLDASPISVLDYTDSTVQSATEYFYVVTSVASNGTQSGYSSQIAVSVP